MKSIKHLSKSQIQIWISIVGILVALFCTNLSAQNYNYSQRQFVYYLETDGQPVYVTQLNNSELLLQYGWTAISYKVKMGGLNGCYYPSHESTTKYGDAKNSTYVHKGKRNYCFQKDGSFMYYQAPTVIDVFIPGGGGGGGISEEIRITGLYGTFKNPQTGYKCVAFFGNDNILYIGVLLKNGKMLSTFKGDFTK